MIFFFNYINLLNYMNRFITFPPFISWINIFYTYCNFFVSFNGLGFSIFWFQSDYWIISDINMQSYFFIFLLLVLISSYIYLAKWVGEVLSFSLFSRLNKGIICSLKICYNSFFKLCKPVMRRFETTDSIYLIVVGIF